MVHVVRNSQGTANVLCYTHAVLPAPSLPKFIPELDGLRGIAILLVLVSHFGYFHPVGGLETVVLDITHAGWTGVDLFFALSGFLITGILLDSKDERRYFRNFYIRRTLRIFPLYFTYLLVFFHVLVPVAHHFKVWGNVVPKGEIWYWLYCTNFLYVFDLGTQMLGPFWSLAVEEQFYLVWPLLVYFMPRRWMWRACAAVVAASWICRLVAAVGYNYWGHAIWEATPTRIEPLAWGALVACIVRDPNLLRISRQAIGKILCVAGAGLAFTLAITRSSTQFTPWMSLIGFTCLSVLFAGMVFHCSTETGSSSVLCRVARNSILRRFGKYSYGIYVLHMLVYYHLGTVVRGGMKAVGIPQNIPTAIVLMAVGIPLSFFVAWVSWHVFEKHFIAMKDKFAPAEEPAAKLAAVAS